MAFSKFDPHRPDERERGAGERKAKLLRWWSVLTMVYTVVGFAFIGYWLFW